MINAWVQNPRKIMCQSFKRVFLWVASKMTKNSKIYDLSSSAKYFEIFFAMIRLHVLTNSILMVKFFLSGGHNFNLCLNMSAFILLLNRIFCQVIRSTALLGQKGMKSAVNFINIWFKVHIIKVILRKSSVYTEFQTPW